MMPLTFHEYASVPFRMRMNTGKAGRVRSHADACCAIRAHQRMSAS